MQAVSICVRITPDTRRLLRKWAGYKEDGERADGMGRLLDKLVSMEEARVNERERQQRSVMSVADD